jgi:hypothetical protein
MVSPGLFSLRYYPFFTGVLLRKSTMCPATSSPLSSFIEVMDPQSVDLREMWRIRKAGQTGEAFRNGMDDRHKLIIWPE